MYSEDEQACNDSEIKRNTLLEILDFADTVGRTAYGEYRLLEDTFSMVSLLQLQCYFTLSLSQQLLLV